LFQSKDRIEKETGATLLPRIPLMPEDVQQLIKQLKELQIQEASLIERIEAASARTPRRETYKLRDSFKIGDHIFVSNRIRRPIRAPRTWTAEKERRGIVFDIKGRQVHFETENGTHTWRDSNNLRLIVAEQP
jgi:hypothetical protein